MATCRRCNKSGFFLKLNINNVCSDCEQILNLQFQENQIRQNIEHMNNILNNQNSLYNSIFYKAQEDAKNNIQVAIDQKQIIINECTQQISGLNFKYNELQIKNKELEDEIDKITKKLYKLQSTMKSMRYAINKEYIDETTYNEINEFIETTINLKLHYMDIKQLRNLYKQNYAIIRNTLSKYKDRYNTKTNKALYKLMVIALESELQNVLYNINYGKLEKAIDDIKAITKKYYIIAIEGNQSIAQTVQKFIGEIEYLFIEAIKIEYEYYIQKERIKEEQRAIREQLRQEAAERKLLEQQKKQIEKEEEKYKNEIQSLIEQLSLITDENKIQQYKLKIEQLNEQVTEIERKKEEIINRQNGQAGYVYVISNQGSFGDNVFKIGMTRRLEPMDRINELGDASVPFPFDVHCLIFSNDAVTLEQNIHKTLNNNRLNKINFRKEFFKTTIDELEELVNSLEPTAEFNKTLLAEQFNKSQSINEIPDFIPLTDDEILETEDVESDEAEELE